MLEFLNILFHALHVMVVIINTTFWMSLQTLRIAQISLALTLMSWLGFGYFYGLGYCFLTDWQWKVKEQMGETDLPNSYIKFVLDSISGIDWDPETVNRGTITVLIASVLGCIIQTVRARKSSL